MFMFSEPEIEQSVYNIQSVYRKKSKLKCEERDIILLSLRFKIRIIKLLLDHLPNIILAYFVLS